MLEIAQILGLSVFIIFLVIIIFIISKPYLIRFSFKDIKKVNIFSILIIILLTIVSTLLSFTILFNDSYLKAVDTEITKKVGLADGVIYSREENKLYSLSEINNIYIRISVFFDKFIPAYLEASKFDDKNVLISGFDENILNSLDSINKSNIKTSDLALNEVIIARSFAESQKLVIGSKINLVTKNQSQEFVIKEILEDDGIVGFTYPRNSRLQKFETNIIVSNSYLEQKFGDKRFNTILLFAPSNVDPLSIQTNLNNEIISIDRNLIYEEIRESYSNSITGGSSGLNISQVILLSFTLPAATLLIIVLMVFNLKLNRYLKGISILKSFGITRRDLVFTVFFEGFIYSLISTVLGIILGLFFSPFIKSIIVSYFAIENPILLNLNFQYDLNSILIIFASSVVIFSLIIFLGVLYIPTLIQNFDLTKEQYIQKNNVFKLKDSSAILMALFGSFVFGYYIISGYVENIDIRNILIYLLIQIIIYLIAYIIVKIQSQLKFRILVLVLTLIFFGNIIILYSKVLESAWKTYPELLILPYILLIISLCLLILTMLPKIKLPLFISSSIKLITKEFRLSFIALILIIISIIGSNVTSYFILQINKSLEDSEFKYDLIAVDALGLSNPDSLKRFALENNGIKSFQTNSSNIVSLPDYNYNTPELAQIASSQNIDLNSEFQETISTLNLGSIETKQINYAENITDAENSFQSSNNYIILGKDYFEQGSKISKPQIKLGDKIKIRIDNVLIERTVIGIINNESSENSDVSSINGIFISEMDYMSLRDQKVYFSTIYGIQVKDKNKIIEIENALVNNFDDVLSSVFQPSQNITNSTLFFLQVLRFIKFYLDSLIFLILGLFIINSYFVTLNKKYQNIQSNKFSIMSASFSQVIILSIGFFLGMIFTYFFLKMFQNYTNSTLNYGINFNEHLANILINFSVIILSALFIFVIRIQNLKNNYGKKYSQ